MKFNFEGLFFENSASNLLDEVRAGLPNITGELKWITSNPMTPENRISELNSSKPLKWKQGSDNYSKVTIDNSPSFVGCWDVLLDVSRSNSIYGNSSTVQPPAVKFLPIIKY